MDDLTKRQIVKQFVPWGDYPDRPGPVAIRRDGKLIAYVSEEEYATDCWAWAVYVAGPIWDHSVYPQSGGKNDAPDMKLRTTTRTKAIAFTTDGLWLLCGPEDGYIYLVSLTQLLGFGAHQLHESPSRFLGGTDLICLSSWDGAIRLLSVSQHAAVRFALRRGPSLGVTDHRLLVATGATLSLYKLGRSGHAQMLAELGDIGCDADALDLSITGELVACASGQSAAVWKLSTGDLLFSTGRTFPALRPAPCDSR